MKNSGTRTILMVSIALAATLCLVRSPAHAQDAGSGPDLAALTAELTKASAGIKAFPAKIQESLTLKNGIEQDAAALTKDYDQLEKSEGDPIEAERPAVRAACTNVTPERAAACNAVLGPFNEKVRVYNVHHAALDTKAEAIQARDKKRVADITEADAQNKLLTARVSELKALIDLAIRAKCIKENRDLPADTAAHALSICYDNASAAITRVLPDPPRSSGAPAVSSGTARTPQQAIDDYKKSGAAQPTSGTRRTAPPPPPPGSPN